MNYDLISNNTNVISCNKAYQRITQQYKIELIIDVNLLCHKTQKI